MAVSFDPTNLLIVVDNGVLELDFKVDVYSAWKEWVLLPGQANAKWPEAITAIGGDPLPGSRQLGSTYFLENGWRMRTWEGDHSLTVTGNVYTRDGDPVFVPTVNPWTTSIVLNISTLVETIVIAGTANSAVADIWNYIIDDNKQISAKDKLKIIASKTQDIALS